LDRAGAEAGAVACGAVHAARASRTARPTIHRCTDGIVVGASRGVECWPPARDNLIADLAPRVQSDAEDVSLGLMGANVIGLALSKLLMSREPARRLQAERKRLAIELLASIAAGAEGRRPPWTPAPS
jgi:hypothetical protein